MDDLDGDEPRRAQEFGRLHHLALAQRHADGAGGHRAAFVLERRHDVDREPQPLALVAQNIAEDVVRIDILGVEFNGAAEFFFGVARVPHSPHRPEGE